MKRLADFTYRLPIGLPAWLASCTVNSSLCLFGLGMGADEIGDPQLSVGYSAI